MFRLRRLKRSSVRVAPTLSNGRVQVVPSLLLYDTKLEDAIRRVIGLPPMRAKILAMFLANVGKPISYRAIYAALYMPAGGRPVTVVGNALSVHMSMVRDSVRDCCGAAFTKLNHQMHPEALDFEGCSTVPNTVPRSVYRLNEVNAKKIRDFLAAADKVRV